MLNHPAEVTIHTEKIGYSMLSYVVITDTITNEVIFKMEYMKFRNLIKKGIEDSLEKL